MSPAERFARHHKLKTDQAISQAYARFAADDAARATFTELLCCVRQRAPSVLAARCAEGHHPGVEALANLSRSSYAHIREISDWPGSHGSWRVAIGALVQHLVAKYPMPRFLVSAWYVPTVEESEWQRRCFIAHGGGRSFRSLDLPIKMTRRMEDIFLRSPDHMDINVAMRRAELIGLGISKELAAAILSTRMATDLHSGEFWRTVWHFLRVNADDIDLTQVAPLIDFIYSIRQERIAVLTPNGMVYREPPDANFSMKGRTFSSMLRLMEEWHRGLKSLKSGLTWSNSNLRPMVVEAPPSEQWELPRWWQFVELTSSKQLEDEGKMLRHCVASYASRCWRGACHIWSLRLTQENKARAVATLEIDPKARAIVQAHGMRNRYPSGKPLQLIRLWAEREGLRLAI
jgi:hypothetical protein